MPFAKKYPLLFLLCISTFFTACKKYPEGGNRDRGNKTIFNQYGWALTLYEVNGIDSTDLIDYNAERDYKNVSFFHETGYNTHTSYAQNGGFTYIIHFESANEVIDFSNYNAATLCYLNNSYNNGCYKLFFSPEGKATRWTVLKLTKKEMIIETSGTNYYKIKLKARK